LEPASEVFLEFAEETLALSHRACQRILKVARTRADVDGSASIVQGHPVETLVCRGIDRN
jgi:magnesium chelatase family protein